MVLPEEGSEVGCRWCKFPRHVGGECPSPTEKSPGCLESGATGFGLFDPSSDAWLPNVATRAVIWLTLASAAVLAEALLGWIAVGSVSTADGVLAQYWTVGASVCSATSGSSTDAGLHVAASSRPSSALASLALASESAELVCGVTWKPGIPPNDCQFSMSLGEWEGMECGVSNDSNRAQSSAVAGSVCIGGKVGCWIWPLLPAWKWANLVNMFPLGGGGNDSADMPCLGDVSPCLGVVTSSSWSNESFRVGATLSASGINRGTVLLPDAVAKQPWIILHAACTRGTFWVPGNIASLAANRCVIIFQSTCSGVGMSIMADKSALAKRNWDMIQPDWRGLAICPRPASASSRWGIQSLFGFNPCNKLSSHGWIWRILGTSRLPAVVVPPRWIKAPWRPFACSLARFIGCCRHPQGHGSSWFPYPCKEVRNCASKLMRLGWIPLHSSNLWYS